jgi:hypothetical protein
MYRVDRVVIPKVKSPKKEARAMIAITNPSTGRSFLLRSRRQSTDATRHTIQNAVV